MRPTDKTLKANNRRQYRCHGAAFLESVLWILGAGLVLGVSLIWFSARYFEYSERESLRREIRGVNVSAERLVAAAPPTATHSKTAQASPIIKALVPPPGAAETSNLLADKFAAVPTSADETEEVIAVEPPIDAPPLSLERKPGLANWAAERIAEYKASLPTPASPVGILSLPSIDIEVLVLDSADKWALNRGVGMIEGTASPCELGNIGIAGHRDGFFRTLGKLQAGDAVA